jgi:hypothetical protein
MVEKPMKTLTTILLLFVFTLPVQGQVKSTPGQAPPVENIEKVDVPTVGMSRNDARKVGLTIRNLTQITRELKEKGQLTGVREVDSELILSKAIERNPKAFSDPTIDWDMILAFIERLLPLIMAIIALF